MKRRRAALVGGIWICPAIEQDFHDGKIPGAHGLMKRCDCITVPSIDRRASLDEQRRYTGRPRALRAPKIGDAVKRSLAKPVSVCDGRSAIKEVSDDLGVERLCRVQEQRCALFVDDELPLCDGSTVAQVYGRDHGDRGARAAEEIHDLVPPPRRRLSNRRELRATRVYLGTSVEELAHERCVAVLRGDRERASAPTIFSVRVDPRDEAGDGRRVPLPDGLAKRADLVHVGAADSTEDRLPQPMLESIIPGFVPARGARRLASLCYNAGATLGRSIDPPEAARRRRPVAVRTRSRARIGSPGSFPTALLVAMRAASDPKAGKFLASYFGTEKSTPFVGLTAVAARRVAVRFAERFDRTQLRRLLASNVPECRFVALEMLVRQYEQRPAAREALAKFYLSNLRHVDHWVLVDTSASYVLGDYLRDKPRTPLYRLARSKRMPERRVAIVATWAFIKAGDFTDTLRIAELLLHDDSELIHRAVGWMLREVGKRSPTIEAKFLRTHAPSMPSLMLRCAVTQFLRPAVRPAGRARVR